MQKLRRERGLPRWIVYHESDNALPADLDNPLSVDAVTHVLKRASNVAFTEMYPGPDELCVHSEEGRFCHELNVPMVLRPASVLPTRAAAGANRKRWPSPPPWAEANERSRPAASGCTSSCTEVPSSSTSC